MVKLRSCYKELLNEILKFVNINISPLQLMKFNFAIVAVYNTPNTEQNNG